MSIYGYIRVSSADQNEDRQVAAMRDAGVPENNIFTDKQSGRGFCIPAEAAPLSGERFSTAGERKSLNETYLISSSALTSVIRS